MNRREIKRKNSQSLGLLNYMVFVMNKMFGFVWIVG